MPDDILFVDTFLRGSGHSYGLGAIFPSTAYTSWQYVASNKVTDTTFRDFEENIFSYFGIRFDINSASD
jgi:hypothetical protein